MSKTIIRDNFIKLAEYCKNEEIEQVQAVDTLFVLPCAFKDCKNLKEITFGLDITRISNAAFENCTSLKDVRFAITDEEKIIEIAEDAFNGCNDVTFRIFASAIKNKCLNRYAKKHNIRVVSMI